MADTQMKLTAYLAARYSRREELCGYRADLAALGIRVLTRWLNGSHQLDNAGRPLTELGELQFESGDPRADHIRDKFAQDDFDDVSSADILFAFTEDPAADVPGRSRGGRHVE